MWVCYTQTDVQEKSVISSMLIISYIYNNNIYILYKSMLLCMSMYGKSSMALVFGGGRRVLTSKNHHLAVSHPITNRGVMVSGYHVGSSVQPMLAASSSYGHSTPLFYGSSWFSRPTSSPVILPSFHQMFHDGLLGSL